MTLQATRPEFLDLFPEGAAPRRLAGDLTWAEGPVYVPQRRAVIFSDVRQNRTWRWTDAGALEPEMDPSHHQNGHCLDAEGRLIPGVTPADAARTPRPPGRSRPA